MQATDNPYDFLNRLAHLRRGSLANHVADQFREAIVSLKLRPGTVLDKSEICARLGVSRSPVGEAMARLKSEGLIDILPQRGTVVSLVSLGAVEDYIFVRKALESEVVRTLAQRLPDGLIEELNHNLQRQREVAAQGDALAFHNLDLEFHEILLNALNNARMKAMVDMARNNLNRARQLSNSQRRIKQGIAEHAEIVEALASGNGDEAASMMRKHLDGVVIEIHQVARNFPQLFTDGIITFDEVTHEEYSESATETV